MNKEECIIYLIRHGETDWNCKKLIQGQTDTKLTENGVLQAMAVAEELKDFHFDAVFSSDLIRAIETAEIIAKKHKLTINHTTKLRERSMGIYEGMPKSVTVDIELMFKQLGPEEGFTFKPHPTVESEKEVIDRLLEHINFTASHYSGKQILMVSHQGVIRAFLRYLNYAPYKKRFGSVIENTGYIRVRTNGKEHFIDETRGVIKDYD